MLRSAFQCLAVILLLSLCSVLAPAQGVITVRLSYKIIRNPADGTLPTYTDATGTVVQVTDNDIDTAVATMNSLSAAYFRGFRFQRVDPVAYVGDKDDATGPSQYFNTDFFANPNAKSLKNQMEAAAMKDPAYAWNFGAINIYINQGTAGGKCSFPTDGENIIVVGAVSANAGSTQLHEVGHYFNLCHTHGCTSGSNDDGVADTLTDNPAWNEDQIAQNNFSGRTYNQLSAGEKQQVDDVILNLMSYHGTVGNQAPIYNAGTTQSQLTEQQLDRWTEAANGARRGVCDGTTVFARASNFYGSGSSGDPYGSSVVATAVAANRPGNNIVLLRPSTFSEAIIINPPSGTTVTLRATRQGAAVLGAHD